VQWPAQALLPLRLRRVARAHRRADVHIGQPERRQLRPNAGQRRVEVQADVVGERLERRDINDRRFIRQAARREAPHDEIVERGEEGGEGLA